MKIAVYTTFCHEMFRLDDWKKYYEGYKDDVYKHVIINNGQESDTEILREAFPDSEIIYTESKVFCHACNLAVETMLKDPEVDAIAQIVNDIKLSPGCLKELYELLYSEDKIGAVCPILLAKDSTKVLQYGSLIHSYNLNFVNVDNGKDLAQVKEDDRIVTAMTGGAFMAKRELLETIDPQDEIMGMYADEVDFSIKSHKAGFTFRATKIVQAWHQHVNAPGRRTRNFMAAYLMGRNHIYLARKHFGKRILFNTIMHRFWVVMIFLMSCIYHKKSKEEFKYTWYIFKGVLAGIRNDMNNDIM